MAGERVAPGDRLLDVDPPARARMLVLPVRLRHLAVSLEDPDGFLTILGAPGRR